MRILSKTIVTLSRTGFWVCVLIVLYLSLVPGTLRPHTGASGHFEHFMAYAATGFLFAPGSRWRERMICALGLAALSGCVEIAQVRIPGRTGEFGGFFYSTMGAWLGLLAGAAVWSVWMARRTSRTS